jgi:hypothetical protein
MRSLTILVVLNFLLISCSGTVQQSELLGKYSFRSSTVNAQLELKSDGTFDQTVAKPTSTATNTGTWKWDHHLGMLVLTDAIDVKDGKGAREWIIALPVVKGFRSLRLQVDSKAGDAYLKQ